MLPVRPPLAPMLAKLVRAVPTGDFLYEPKWDGFRALAFRDGGALDMRSRADKPLARYFPEVVAELLALDEPRFVLDGEIIVQAGPNVDFAALMARLHPAASRVERLRDETPASFVAFDLLAVGDEDLRRAPFGERRRRLEALVGTQSRRHLALTPQTADPAAAASWLTRAGGGIDGAVAKERSQPYEPGRRTMIKVKSERTCDCVVAGMRIFEGEPSVSSLLLGVYDERDRLVHVGVVSQLTEARRRALVRDLAPLAVPLAGHPWEHGFNLDRSPLGRLKGSAGRWTPDMVPDWVPLAPSRVCEVAYGLLDDRRFRYPARLLRWRPDREPMSCRFDQLPSASPSATAELAP